MGVLWNAPRNGLDISMEGMWKVDVTATRPGIPTVTSTFNVDVR